MPNPASGSVIRVPVADGELAVGSRGVGPPVLLLHGISANRSVWDGVIALLSSSFHVVAPDLLGRGESTARHGARYRLIDEAERIRVVVHALALERPLLVGHSLGAAIAVAATPAVAPRGLLLLSPLSSAVRRPRALAALCVPGMSILAGGLLPLVRRTLTRYILERRVYADKSRATAETVERYAQPYRDPRRAMSLTRALADWRPEELQSLPRPTVPVRVISGACDRRITSASARALAARLGAPCSILASCGHGLPEEAPEEVDRHVREMMAGCPAGEDTA